MEQLATNLYTFRSQNQELVKYSKICLSHCQISLRISQWRLKGDPLLPNFRGVNPFCQPIGIRNSTNLTDFELRSQEIDKKLEEEKGGKTVGCEYVVIGMLPINIRAARLLPQITQNHFFRT